MEFQLQHHSSQRTPRTDLLYSGWLDLLAVQGTLKSLLQHHTSKASILLCSAFFTVQLSHPYMTTGKTIALTRWTFVGKVMSLLLNMLSRLVITFLPRSKRKVSQGHFLLSFCYFEKNNSQCQKQISILIACSMFPRTFKITRLFFLAISFVRI